MLLQYDIIASPSSWICDARRSPHFEGCQTLTRLWESFVLVITLQNILITSTKRAPICLDRFSFQFLAPCAIWNVLVFSISEDPNGTPALEPSTGNMNTAEKSTSSINAANAIGEADKIGRANGDNDLNE